MKSRKYGGEHCRIFSDPWQICILDRSALLLLYVSFVFFDWFSSALTWLWLWDENLSYLSPRLDVRNSCLCTMLECLPVIKNNIFFFTPLPGRFITSCKLAPQTLHSIFQKMKNVPKITAHFSFN